jgi:hypothetical protein
MNPPSSEQSPCTNNEFGSPLDLTEESWELLDQLEYQASQRLLHTSKSYNCD